jgi:HAD superfamily phosphatase (TIGR01668 family)
MFRLATPHYRVSGVEELTIERLREWGLRWLLLDVDCTLKRYRHSDPTPAVLAWIDQARAAGIGLCLVSNGMGGRIGRLAERLGLPWVAKAMKPLPRGVRAAMEKLQAEPSETAMVGDQLFADIMAGRLAGIRTILVKPMHPEEEPWFTRLKRWPERVLLRRIGRSSKNGGTG